MTDEEKISRLMWLDGISDEVARQFLRLWDAMREIERECDEEERVAHARFMSQGRRTR